MFPQSVSKPLAATLLGILLGHVGGDKSIVIAKLFRCLPGSEPSSCENWKVLETSSLILVVFLIAGCVFGVIAEKRG